MQGLDDGNSEFRSRLYDPILRAVKADHVWPIGPQPRSKVPRFKSDLLIGFVIRFASGLGLLGSFVRHNKCGFDVMSRKMKRQLDCDFLEPSSDASSNVHHSASEPRETGFGGRLL